jgi:hypothetical protein
MADMLWEHPDGSKTFHESIDGVWQHPCGSQFFYLNDDGTVTCASCDQLLGGFTWARNRSQ